MDGYYPFQSDSNNLRQTEVQTPFVPFTVDLLWQQMEPMEFEPELSSFSYSDSHVSNMPLHFE